MGEIYFMPVNTVLLSATDTDEGVIQATEYARFHKFEKGDIKIIRKDGQVNVIALKPVKVEVIELKGEGLFLDHLKTLENKENGN